MGSLSDRYRAALTPQQHKYVTSTLVIAGVLSLSIPLVVEGGRFLVRLRRSKQGTWNAGVTTKPPPNPHGTFNPSTTPKLDRGTRSKKSLVYRVVLTGGPCSGKTSSLQSVQEACRQAGFEPFLVPEVPTILIAGGAAYPGIEGGKRLIAFEVALLRLQLQIEDSFAAIARSLGKPTVVVSDRGSLDIAAYLMPKDWLATLAVLGLSNSDLLARYDQVVHLVTAADGAPTFYTLTNNQARTETAKDARVIDRRIKAAWAQHPHHLVVDNGTDFAGKLARVMEGILTGARAFFQVGEKDGEEDGEEKGAGMAATRH